MSTWLLLRRGCGHARTAQHALFGQEKAQALSTWFALLRGGTSTKFQAGQLLDATALLSRLFLPTGQQYSIWCRGMSTWAILPNSKTHWYCLPGAVHVRAVPRQHRASGLPSRLFQSLARPMELHCVLGGRRLPSQSHAPPIALPMWLRVQRSWHYACSESLPSWSHVRRGRRNQYRAPAL